MALRLTKNDLIDSAILIAVTGFLLSYFRSEYLLSATTITGGDMGTHYYSAVYMKDYLLPNGKITGWLQGNYGGFPLFQFYFPLPFILSAFAGTVMPIQIAFKLVSVLGIFLLPVCTYISMRLLKFSFPVPIFSALFTLPFLFMEANSMWGGNIPSTLSGEFTFSLSLALGILFLGVLYRGITTDRLITINAVLLAAIGLTHAYSLLFAGAASLFFLMTTEDFLNKLWYLLRLHLLSFMLMGAWIVPMLYYMPFTTRFHFVWWIDSLSQVFPLILLPFVAIALIGRTKAIWNFFKNKRPRKNIEAPKMQTALKAADLPSDTAPAPDYVVIAQFIGRIKPAAMQLFARVRIYGNALFDTLSGADKTIIYLWFCVFISILFYLTAYGMNLIDTKFLPFTQFLPCLLAAAETGKFMKRVKLIRIAPVIACLAVFLWTDGNTKYIETWIKWNYSGFENKSLWPQFSEINAYLKGSVSDSRVVYENTHLQQIAGTVRAFEMLPLFSGRGTLEGLYMQSSPSSPYVYYIQSEISSQASCPLPDYGCSAMNLGSGIKHLKMFNVKDFIVRTDIVRDEIRKYPELVLRKSIPPYDIYELTSNENKYVVPLQYEPVLYATDKWETLSYKWFRDSRINDVHIAFTKRPDETDRQKFKTIIYDNSLEALPLKPLNNQCNVKEDVRNEIINIKTDCLHKPLLVKISYHPRWKVEGAEKVYLVSPAFMLIFPEKEDITLRFSNTWVEYSGNALSVFAFIVMIFSLPAIRLRWTAKPFVKIKEAVHTSLQCFIRDTIFIRNKKIILALAFSLITISVVIFGLATRSLSPQTLFQNGMRLFENKKYTAAKEVFDAIIRKYPATNFSTDSRFFNAICLYLEGDYPKALDAFRIFIKDFPDSPRAAEAFYHMGLSYAGMKDYVQAKRLLNSFISNNPESHLTVSAGEKLTEIEAKDKSQ